MVDAGGETREEEEDAVVAVEGDGWCRPSGRARAGRSTAVANGGAERASEAAV